MLNNQPLSWGSSIGSATTNGSQLNLYQLGTVQAATAPVTTPSVGGAAMPDVTVQSPTTPGTQGAQQGPGWFGEGGKLNTIIGGVQVLGSLWNSYQQHKMAKEQMAFAREQWDTNLANQTQTYNTALEDRIRARHHTEGRGSSETDAYLAEHSL